MALSIDNPEFNVKGKGTEMLLKALELGFYCAGHSKAEAFKLDKKKGLILYWNDKSSDGHEINKFVAPLNPEQIFSQVVAFLESDFVKEMLLEGNDKEELDECDIDNDLCWRIYTEKWGRVGDGYAFLAITPSFGWTGK